jgi:hypothetical protein
MTLRDCDHWGKMTMLEFLNFSAPLDATPRQHRVRGVLLLALAALALAALGLAVALAGIYWIDAAGPLGDAPYVLGGAVLVAAGLRPGIREFRRAADPSRAPGRWT